MYGGVTKTPHCRGGPEHHGNYPCSDRIAQGERRISAIFVGRVVTDTGPPFLLATLVLRQWKHLLCDVFQSEGPVPRAVFPQPRKKNHQEVRTMKRYIVRLSEAEQWSLRLLGHEAVEVGNCESISNEIVSRMLRRQHGGALTVVLGDARRRRTGSMWRPWKMFCQRTRSRPPSVDRQSARMNSRSRWCGIPARRCSPPQSIRAGWTTRFSGRTWLLCSKFCGPLAGRRTVAVRAWRTKLNLAELPC